MLPTENRTVIDAPPAMRWGAIIGGWLVATGIASLLYVGGLALGFSAFDPNNAEATAKGIGMGTAGWMVLTWTVSLLLGGMFASWFDGRLDQTIGALHGVTVWGLSIAASGLLIALGGAQVLQGGAAMTAGWQAQPAQRVAQADPQGGSTRDASAQAPAQAQAGVTANTVDPAEADRRKASAKAAADAAKRYTAAAMCVAFFSTLFSLVAAALGGWLGAGHIRRVHHLHRYEAAATTPR